jgi:hypothetical protein
MAKQQQPTGEGKAPLVIALAFFVLTSLILGVLLYLAYDQMAQVKNDANEKIKAADEAKKALSKADEKALLYKAAIGIATQAELDTLKDMRNESDVRGAYNDLIGGVRNKLQGTPNNTEDAEGLNAKAQKLFIGKNVQFNVKPEEVVKWTWAEGTKIATPERSMVAAVVDSHARAQLAASEAQAVVKASEQDKQTYKDGTALAAKAKDDFEKEAKKFPAEVKTIQTTADQKEATTRKTFGASTQQYTNDLKQLRDDLGNRDIKIQELERILEANKMEIARLREENLGKVDPFPFDSPHGKVLARKGNMVDINLGSAQRVRPGLVFNIRGADSLQPGAQLRRVPKLGPDGKQIEKDGVKVFEVPPKGTIEVIEVLGPDLSLARITETVDPIRDSIMNGDLLYNPAWRKDGADRVALYGVFDVDADGIDDIRTVIRDLTKMGVIVDAYFDLEQKKWVDPSTGKATTLTPQTVYAIEGYHPIQGGGEGLAAAKSALEQSLQDCKRQAQEKGARIVRIREFFPRIGYKVRLDISADTINRAYNRYLQSLPPAEPAEAKN